MNGVVVALLAGGAVGCAAAAHRRKGRDDVRQRLTGRDEARPEQRAMRANARAGLRSHLSVRAVWIVLGLIAGSVVAGPPGAVAGVTAALVVPTFRQRRGLAREHQRLEDQLAEGVGSIAAGLRAGLSLSQAIRFAAAEGDAPLADSLRAITDRESLGAPLAEALDGLLVSSSSSDMRLVGSVLQLHRRTGGDLPAVLDQVARTLRDRRAAAREIHGYTAQARLSGAILGLLPIGFFLFLSATSRQDIALAYHSPVGQVAIGVGLALEAIAFVWIRALLRVAG